MLSCPGPWCDVCGSSLFWCLFWCKRSITIRISIFIIARLFLLPLNGPIACRMSWLHADRFPAGIWLWAETHVLPSCHNCFLLTQDSCAAPVTWKSCRSPHGQLTTVLHAGRGAKTSEAIVKSWPSLSTCAGSAFLVLGLLFVE